MSSTNQSISQTTSQSNLPSINEPDINELHQAFSCLPYVYSILANLDHSQNQQVSNNQSVNQSLRTCQSAVDALINHLSEADQLIDQLPSISVSANDQLRLIDRLTKVKEQKEAIAKRYLLGDYAINRSINQSDNQLNSQAVDQSTSMELTE